MSPYITRKTTAEYRAETIRRRVARAHKYGVQA